MRNKTKLDKEHNMIINRLISKLIECGFSKTIDYIETFSEDEPPLYYKKISDDRYLIFNHWNLNNKFTDGLDCWIATYENEKDIGYVDPIDYHEIRLGFRLERDWHLIEHYI